MSKETQLSEMDRIRLNLNFIKSNPLELYPQFHRRIFNSTYQESLRFCSLFIKDKTMTQ